MGLKTNTGYVAIAIATGFDEKTLTVSWATFKSQNYREEDPLRIWSSIYDRATHTFDLAIKELQVNELGEEIEVVTGYLSQTKETAHELLRNLAIEGANFKGINFQIVI